MDRYRILELDSLWLFIATEATVWLGASIAFVLLFHRVSSNAKAWVLRFAFGKFWVTCIVSIVLLLTQRLPENQLTLFAKVVWDTGHLVTALLLIGLACSLLMTARIIYLHFSISRIAKYSQRLEDRVQIDEYVKLAKPFECWNVPIVFVTGKRSSSALVGLWKQAILLPERLIENGIGDDCKSVLAHELAHVKRRDPIWSLVVLYAVAAMPWNPIVHWAARLYGQLVEEACDETVLSNGVVEQKEYADLIVRESSGSLVRSQVEGLAFGGAAYHGVKSRIERIAAWEQGRFRIHWAVSFLLVALSALPPIASPSASSRSETERLRAEGFPQYDVDWIPEVKDRGLAKAWEINDSGVVAVSFDWRHPYTWTKDKGLTLLPYDGYDSQSNCINSSGLVAGGMHRFIGVFGPGREKYAELGKHRGHVWEVSDTGYMAGRIDVDGKAIAMRYHPNEGIVRIPIPTDFVDSQCGAINSLGHVIGASTSNLYSSNVASSWVWYGKGPAVMLSRPDGLENGGGGGINDHDVIAGGGNSSVTGIGLPLKWTSPTDCQVMEQLPLRPNCGAWSLNNDGWAVGNASSNDGALSRAVIWNPGNKIADLNELVDLPAGWIVSEAHDINNKGQITATAKQGTKLRAVVLTPRIQR